MFAMFKKKKKRLEKRNPRQHNMGTTVSLAAVRYGAYRCLSVIGYVIWCTTKTHKMISSGHFICLLVRELYVNLQ